MSNNKQSSIDFILDKIPNSYRSWLNKYIEQAKAMHKDEIVNSILDNRNITSQVTFKDAEQYYNERFIKE